MENISEQDLEFLSKTLIVSQKSIARKRKVGALITSYNIILSEGFNHNHGICCENKNGETFDTVVHAEEQAVINFLKLQKNKDLDNLTIYCTYSPCMTCCRLIVHSGIKRLIFIENHLKNFDTPIVKGSLSPKQYLEINGVKIIQYKEITEITEK